MGFLNDLLKNAAQKIGNAFKKEARESVASAAQKASDKAAQAAGQALHHLLHPQKKEEEKPADALTAAETAAASADPFAEAQAAVAAASGAAAQGPQAPAETPVGLDAFWQGLHDRWEQDQADNAGYVWTVSIDSIVRLDAMGLADVKYDLKLSASHVGCARDGVYRGSLSMAYGADLSGVNELMGSLGGRASTGHLSGWFRNDAFVMDLTPYNKIKEEAFLSTLDTVINADGEVVPASGGTYADAVAAPMLAQMGSKPQAFENTLTPLSYWFDWDHHMTSGDLSGSYAITGVMGIASAHATVDTAGTHVEGAGTAVSPFGVFHERYSKDFESPFPYVIRVYEDGRVVFELHSPNGGPVVIKFYGTLDRIPVSQTTVVS